jgi:dTDP-4-amino-4,6-dideoxygalactose transaminase
MRLALNGPLGLAAPTKRQVRRDVGGFGIETERHYSEPVHFAPADRQLGYAAGDFPAAEALAREGLSLPPYPGISEARLESVSQASFSCSEVADCLNQGVERYRTTSR